VRAESEDNGNSTVTNSDQAQSNNMDWNHSCCWKSFRSLPGISLSFSSNQYD